MRYSILLFFLFASFCDLYSQTTALAYYVTKTNDGVIAHIKIPKSILGGEHFSKFLLKVEIVDSINGIKKFKPNDVKSFEFLYKEQRYRFFSKHTMTVKNVRFLQPCILGQKISIYWFHTADQNGVPLSTFFTLEKADGTYTFFSTAELSLTKFRASLKEFYKDYLEVQQLIDTKFQTRTYIKNDLVEIVKAVNKS